MKSDIDAKCDRTINLYTSRHSGKGERLFAQINPTFAQINSRKPELLPRYL
ncbi:hypothetical protein [Brunnivagina elsteri]|uniref:hypothetical protein n=1 Tax=Brunnivagina elsteri TaxID=1247191 RepID=UPI0013041DE2|nr:hypothetical protein [Calothrix elsteri]